MDALTPSPQPRYLPLNVLHLDANNPRLPAEIQGAAEEALLEFIAANYNAVEIARSIARHGYFESEPLIVLEQPDATYLVVEGNRRLVALRILADPALAGDLDDADEWAQLARTVDLRDSIPVVVAASREEVAPIIGYRHISGIEPWEPYAKARFIAHLVDSGMDFVEVSSIVGEPITNVAAQYRNYAIVRQAQEEFAVDPGRVIRRFGVFTRALNSLPLRTYIRALAPSQVLPRRMPLPDNSRDNLRELFSWLFGDPDHPPVISESRNITELGTVVGSPDGLALLKTTRDLETSFVAAGGLHQRMITRLSNARANLLAAKEDISAYADDDEVRQLLESCQEALNELTQPDATT